MNGEKTCSYSFKSFRLDVEERRLFHNGVPISLEPKVFDVLAALIERNGHLVGKAELLKLVWSDSFVEEANVARTVYTLRKILGENRDEQKFIETVAKRGYRFIAEVRRVEEETEPTSGEGRIHSEPKQISTQNFSRLVGQTEPQKTGAVVALAEWRPETDKNQPEESNGQSAKLKLVPAKLNSESAAAETETINSPKTTKRRKGLLRGLKFWLWGLGIGFVFNLLMKVFLIISILLLHSKNSALPGTSNQLAHMIVDLLIMLEIPIGLGLFVGIGLFLFGITRIVYAFFEKESSKINSLLIERLIAAIIIIIILAVAIPNLIFSYRQANRARQTQTITADDNKTPPVFQSIQDSRLTDNGTAIWF